MRTKRTLLTTARRLAAVALLLVALARPASAARTDVIVLTNNDHITGEVKTLSRGQLQVKTDDLGTINIEWDKIAVLTTAGRFDIATTDGRRLVGAFGPAPAGQTGLGIISADGAIVTRPFLDVVAFGPIRQGFFEKIDGSLDLGASYSQSSGVGQVAFSTDGAYRQPSFEAVMAFSTTVSQTSDAPRSARYSLNGGYSRFHANRWVSGPLGIVEHNPDLGFDLRSTAAMQVGRYVVQSNRATVLLGGGIAFGRELPVGESAITNVDGLIGLSASFYTYDFPKTSVDLSVLTFPAIKDAGRIRVTANAKLKRELLRDFFISATGYDSFDSRPPGVGAQENGFEFSLSLGWTF